LEDYVKLVADIVIYLSIGCSVIYLIGFTKNSKAYRLFAIYLFLIAVIQFISYYIGRGGLKKPNLFMSHYYFISQFILLSLFYYELLKKVIIKKILIVVLLALAYQYFEMPELYFKYNVLGITITQAIIVVYSMFYFYKSLNGKRDFLIVNVGVFIYLLSSVLIFASGNLMLNLNISKETRLVLVNLNRGLMLVFQLLILVEWWRNYRIKLKKI